MNNQLDVAWFDWKAADDMVQFIQDITADQPMCFRQVETDADSYVLVFSERPVSQKEAQAFYQQNVVGEKRAKKPQALQK